jgi:hypothetical protein
MNESVEMQAARLALLAVRAGIARDTTLVADRVILAPGDEAIPVDVAAARLSALPKPLVLEWSTRDGVLVVDAHAPRTPFERHRFESVLPDRREEGGPLDFLSETHDIDSGGALIFAVGRDDDSLLLTLEAVESWDATYFVRGGYGADAVDLASDDAVHRAAAARGAVGYMRFHPTNGAHLEMRSIPAAGPGEMLAPERQEEAESALLDAVHFMQPLVEKLAQLPLHAPPSGHGAPADGSRAARHLRKRSMHDAMLRAIPLGLAEQLARAYEGRPMPAEVRHFLETVRALPASGEPGGQERAR